MRRKKEADLVSRRQEYELGGGGSGGWMDGR